MGVVDPVSALVVVLILQTCRLIILGAGVRVTDHLVELHQLSPYRPGHLVSLSPEWGVVTICVGQGSIHTSKLNIPLTVGSQTN